MKTVSPLLAAIAGDRRQEYRFVVLDVIQGDMAIEQTVFAIKSTSKNGGESHWFRGRTQVVYVRTKRVPQGGRQFAR